MSFFVELKVGNTFASVMRVNNLVWFIDNDDDDYNHNNNNHNDDDDVDNNHNSYNNDNKYFKILTIIILKMIISIVWHACTMQESTISEFLNLFSCNEMSDNDLKLFLPKWYSFA